ncbi:hypothetical protein [Nonomuraea recticatena]
MTSNSPKRRPADDVDAAKRLYLEDELSVREVAWRLGWSHTAIYDVLVAAGVPLRPTGSSPRRIPAEVREAVVAEYAAGERMSVLCSRYGVAAQSVRNMVSEAGGSLRLGGATLAGRSRFDREQAAALADQGWTVPSIAILTGFCEGHVRRQLREMGYGRKPLPDADELAEMFDEAGSVRVLAVRLGCTQSRVRNALKAAGIKRLPKTQVLVRMLARTRSGKAVAAELGCSFSRVRKALERAGVPVKAVAAR